MKKTTAKPPSDLSRPARDLWRKIAADYDIADPHGCHLLTTAMRAFDRMEAARAMIAAEGMVQRDRFDQAKPHPAIVIERDSRAGMLAALKALNLDVEPLRDGVGRPPGR